jgi:hypothetical protein
MEERDGEPDRSDGGDRARDWPVAESGMKSASIHKLTSADRARWLFLKKNATWGPGFG